MSHSLLFRSGRVLFLAALTLVLGASAAVAQQSRVEGTVRSSQNRDPVASARVSVVGTNLFATTNENGYYAIENVPVGTYDVRVQVIGFQSVVYTNQRVAAGLPTTVNFELSPSILRIEGVVVTGVAEQTQAVKLPFTVEQLGGEDMPVPTQTAEESIRGKVAGARVIRGEGRPGSGVQVLLRGATSINTTGRSNEPLYVVDGVILGASMVDIDALDIENIEVVKGAAAAALYGARAANGVISITTARGGAIPDGETRIQVRSEFGRNQIEHPVAVSQSHFYQVDASGNWLGQSAAGQDSTVSANDRVFAAREYDWRPRLDRVTGACPTDVDPACVAGSYVIADNAYGGTTYDQLDRFFDPGQFYTNSVSVSHRTGNTNFLASAHETSESGVVSGMDGYTRRGARMNVDHRIGRAFDFNASAFYSQSVADDPNIGEGSFFALLFYPRDVDLLELNPEEVRRDSNDFYIQPDPTIVESNPIYVARNNDITRVRGRVLGNVGVRWRPTEVVDFSTDFSFDRSDRTTTTFYFKGFRTTDATNIRDGRLQKDQDYDQAINWSATLSLNKQVGDLNTNFKLRTLVERQASEAFWARAQTLVVDDVEDMSMGTPEESRVGGGTSDVRSFGYFASLQLDFKDRYIGDFLLRRDGSSLFGAEQRWHWYYRAGGAYRMSEESWFPFSFLDEFKVRYSRGTAGARPSFNAQYETYNVESGVVSKGNLGNANLRPENATEQEVGVDMIALGRLGLGITYAHSVVTDQILLVPLAGFYGFGNQWRNAGTITGKTWEGSMQLSILQGQNVGWNTSFVIDRTRQVITEFDLPPFTTGPGGAYYVRKNEKLGTMYGHRWATTCSEIETPSGLGAACDHFDLNDDGFLVPVGAGHSYTEGIDNNYYGSQIVIDGRSYYWGFPIYANEIRVDTLPGGQIQTDTTDFVKVGSAIPDFNFGLTNDFRIKGLSIHTLFDAQIGGDVYNNTRQWPTRENNIADVDQAGKVENQKKPLDYYQRLYDVNDVSSEYVEDGTFLKFRELSVRYTINRGQLENVFGGFFKRVTIAVIGRNLKTWTNYTGYDPEVSTSGDAGIYRYDSFEYPNYRTFTGSIELEF